MLTINNVTVEYPDGTKAINNLSLNVKSGEKLALIGANGAGKSTLMLAIEGILDSTGEIKIDDLVVDSKNKYDKKSLYNLRKEVGIVFQDPEKQIFYSMVYDDIAFGPRNAGLDEESVKYRVEDRLKLLNIEHLKDKTALKLSGGEKRMAALATVLAMKPSVMLLDEPTAFLDPKARRNLINVLNSLPHTMLIATHDLTFAKEVCREAVVIKDGNFFAKGNCDEILYNQELMDEGGIEAIM